MNYTYLAEGRQDRVRVTHTDRGLALALADGAGGTSNGTETAAMIVNSGFDNAVAALMTLDGRVPGESTAVLLLVTDEITGASVGDSGAWLVGPKDTIDLTHKQHRKPLVGGGAQPVAISPTKLDGTLVVASDGLFAYAKREDIERVVRNTPELEAAAQRLVELVRLPNRTLPDDIAIILVRSS